MLTHSIVVNIMTDLLLAFLPIPLIWQLHLNVKTRLSLVFILSLGVFASVAAILRQQNAGQFRMPEPYISDAYSIWNFIELDIGIIAASLPALKPLLNWFYDAARGLTRPTKTTGYGSGHVQGYEKHVENRDIVLKQYKSGPSVSISTQTRERTGRGKERHGAKESEESILSPDQRESISNGIMATRQVQVQ